MACSLVVMPPLVLPIRQPRRPLSDEFLAQQKIRKVDNALRVAPWTEAVTAAPHKDGRNDPCPCGSGKNFKTCYLH